MQDYEVFNQVSIKILELKRKRDELKTNVMKDRFSMNDIEEKCSTLYREKQKVQLDITEKEIRVRKYAELIE